MIPLIQQYFKENPLKYNSANIHTLPEYLWQCYTDLHPIDNEKIRSGFDELDAHFESLGLPAVNAVFCLVVGLCQEHERLAFAEGVRLGAQLILELTDTSDPPLL